MHAGDRMRGVPGTRFPKVLPPLTEAPMIRLPMTLAPAGQASMAR